MTDYNPPDDTEIATSKAIKATTGRRLRDMSIAIAEGADGAPRVQGVALGGRLYGIYTPSADSWQTFTDLDNVSAISIDGYTTDDSLSPIMYIQFSTDGGANWSSSVDLGSVTAATGEFSTFRAVIDFASGKYIKTVGNDGSSRNSSYGTFTARTSTTNAFRIRIINRPAVYAVMIEGGFS